VQTATAQQVIRERSPWAFIPDPAGDPAVEGARQAMAAKYGTLGAGGPLDRPVQ
jgi:hypothetical protein